MSGALSRPGAAPMLSKEQENLARKARLQQLAIDTIDIKNDPYFMRNHLGKIECKLCLTIHTNEGSYMSHTQGKRHQQNLGQRNARMQARGMNVQPAEVVSKPKIVPKKTPRIGRPGYKIVKQRSSETGQKSLLFQLQYPQIQEGLRPRYRFMSAFEQRVEPSNDKFQYIVFAAEPYETIAFRIPNQEIDKSPEHFFTHWDDEKNTFTLQFFFQEKGAKKSAASSSSSSSSSTMNDMDIDEDAED